MAAFDARYQEEVQVAAAAAATNERYPAFSADHINDIKEAMRGISLPANAPAWAQVHYLSSQPNRSFAQHS
jgi:chloramphenicol O-acetyltransferase